MRTASFPPGLEYTLKKRMPFGVLGVRENAGQILAIDYLPSRTVELAAQSPVAIEADCELDAYVDNPRWKFKLPYFYLASDFETDVWEAIRAIPPGQTRTYGAIARQVRSIPRAVGGACGRNPLPLIIPCHRVVAAGGRIGGFMGGREDDPLAIKRWLLQHEGALA